MDFGVHLAHEKLPLQDGIGRMAVAAEEYGFDAVWVSDRVVVPRDFSLDAEHAALSRLADRQDADPMVALAYVAGQTKRVSLGTSVMVLPLRNPLVTAKMLATLDVLSGGRVILGAGIGWVPEEFKALAAPDYAQRGQVAEEWIRILRACWLDGHPAYDGDHYQFKPVYFSPRPVRPIPIWIGGNSPPALRRAGRLGDGWLGSRVALADIPLALARVKEAAEAAGRDPAKLTFAAGLEVDIVDPGAKCNERGLVGPPERGLIGTVEEIGLRAKALEAAGIQHLELRFRTAQDQSIGSIEPTLEVMHRFAEEVMCQFNRQANAG